MYGFLFGLSLFFFAFMLISAIIRALYIFVVSSFVLIIYIFVSPIIFPLILFEKTKNIFNRWFMHMLAFSLQPILMFAYISIFLNATDYLIFGKDPVFKDRQIECNIDGQGAGYLSNNKDNKRLACLLQFKDFKKGGSLAIFGVFIPMAKMLFSLDLMIVAIKAVIGIYLLLQMFSLIPELINAIFGISIDKHHGDAKNMFLDFVSKLRFIQKHTASIAWQKGFGAGKETAEGIYKKLTSNSKTDKDSGGAF
jgi:type IV secretion system protein VirB6